MTEILEPIKAKIARFQNQGILFTLEEVLPLITTIESLNERIEIKDQALEGAREMFNQYVEKRNVEVLIWKDAATFANNHKLSTTSLQKELGEKDALIESQKEEIEKLNRGLLNAGEYAARGLLDEAELREEIESLKAITELAVKALKQLQPYGSRFELPFITNLTATTLSEIEKRLQNE